MYQLYTSCLASATGASSHQSRLYGDCYTAYASYQLHALNREGRELSATTLREVMHSREPVNKHGEATQPADMLAYCFRRFISGDIESLNASSIGNKSTIENTDSTSSSE
eukprot:10281412-Karenia_brevis.AAC.1